MENEVATMSYTPEFTDYELSPYTGLTRESWVAAGKYMLKGVFDNLSGIDAPVVMPRKETKVTYPHLDAPENVQAAERKAEIFEGLTRSFFIASVIINDEPKLSINGIELKEYYKLHILRSCTEKDSDEYAGSYEEMLALTNSADPFKPFQQTVETCALVIGLYMCRDVLWDEYTQTERDSIAEFLKGFAHANTVPQNWRLFNMLDMAFLYMNGYEIDKDKMLDHAQAVLSYYVGDGWYRDGHSFDYYSCWAFNMYAPLWNRWYGYENLPGLAAEFEKNSNRLMESYAQMFDEDGFTNMWGRSCIYRNAATSPFDGNFFLNNPKADPGLARRISSGSLLQFLKRDDFLYKGIPTLGFYGQFTPLVQGYSCAESPFWIGKAYLCLHLPKEHPFWSAKENNGVWEELKEDGVKETVLDGPALAFTNHKANGETVLRSAKVVKAPGDVHGMWNYSKLCFNTKYPWESTPKPSGQTEAATPDIESQQYVLKSLLDGHTELGNVTFYAGSRDGVLYRRQFFNYNLETECHWLNAVDLADFPVSRGIIRVDKLRIIKRPFEITLGGYGFPDPKNMTAIETKADTIGKAIILKGRDSQGNFKRLAMTIYDGWEKLSYIKSKGTNPDCESSIVVYATGALKNQYDSSEPYVFISQVIPGNDEKAFTEEELFPVERIDYEDENKTGAYGRIKIKLKNGEERIVDYTGTEGNMRL